MQEVHLFFSSTIHHDTDVQQVDFTTKAEYVELADGGIELTFVESNDDHDDFTTQILMYQDHLFLSREGEATMKQHFVLGEEQTGQYQTVFGGFVAKAHTHEIVFLEEADQNILMVTYDYFLNDIYTGKVKLEIKYSKGGYSND